MVPHDLVVLQLADPFHTDLNSAASGTLSSVVSVLILNVHHLHWSLFIRYILDDDNHRLHLWDSGFGDGPHLLGYGWMYA